MCVQEFRFKVGDLAYLNDSLTKVSRRVTRVKVVKLHGYGGEKAYWCLLVRHRGHGKYKEIGPPRLIREEVLDDKPHALGLGPRQRARWMKRRAETPIPPK